MSKGTVNNWNSPSSSNGNLSLLAKKVQSVIEDYRQCHTAKPDGLSTICKHCWEEEYVQIMRFLDNHLKDFGEE